MNEGRQVTDGTETEVIFTRVRSQNMIIMRGILPILFISLSNLREVMQMIYHPQMCLFGKRIKPRQSRP